MNMYIFWNFMFCRLVDGYVSRECSPSIFRVNHSTWRHLAEDLNLNNTVNRSRLVDSSLFRRSAVSPSSGINTNNVSFLTTGAVGCSETLVYIHHFTQHNIPENMNCNNYGLIIKLLVISLVNVSSCWNKSRWKCDKIYSALFFELMFVHKIAKSDY